MKNNCCSFERISKVQLNGVFFFGYLLSLWRYLCFSIMQISNVMRSFVDLTLPVYVKIFTMKLESRIDVK